MGAGFAVFDLDGTLTSSDTYKRFLRARLRAKPWRLAHCVPLAWHYRVAVREGRDHIWLKQKALVGDIDGINCFGDEKIRRLDAVVGSGERGTVTAYTDHHSDQPLLDWADKPVAVSPTRHMREAAKSKGYAVEDWHAKAAFGRCT